MILNTAAQKMGINVFRGDESNVLKRFFDAAVAHQTVIVRLLVTAQQFTLIDEVIGSFERQSMITSVMS